MTNLPAQCDAKVPLNAQKPHSLDAPTAGLQDISRTTSACPVARLSLNP